MKNFLFTLTTGRSGTKYLAELLRRNLPHAECHHEICGWDRFGVDTPDVSHMTLFNSQGNVEKVRSFWRSKLGRVAATPQAWYVETSHLLMKAGLVENLAPLTEDGTVHLIALERDPYATIVSFRNRFDFWGKADRWLWYLDPEYPRNLVPSRELFAKGINGLCLWYILEIRARTSHYERLLERAPHIRVHRFGLEELRVPGGAARLLQALDYPTDPARIQMPSPQNVGRMLVRIDAAEEASIRRMIAAEGLDRPSVDRRPWLASTPC